VDQTDGKRNKKTETCKTKPVLSEAWAELSPPKCKERWRRNEEGGWVQVRRGKNPRQGESVDKDKDKTDGTTTNKQDPQDTPAGRQIDTLKRKGERWKQEFHPLHSLTKQYIEYVCGYGSIPIHTFLVGWTSIYQLFWGSLGTRVLTHPRMWTKLTYWVWVFKKDQPLSPTSQYVNKWTNRQIESFSKVSPLPIPNNTLDIWRKLACWIMFIFHTPSPKKEFVEDRKKVGIMTESFLKLTPLDLTVDMLSHFTVYPSLTLQNKMLKVWTKLMCLQNHSP